MINEEVIKEKERLEKQINNGANTFKWIAALSIINTILLVLHANFWFVGGLGSTVVVQGFSLGFARSAGNNTAIIIGYIIEGLIAILFLIIGAQCKRKKNSAFIAGMILYVLDTLIFLGIKDYGSIAFHIFFLISIFIGYRASNKIKKLYVTYEQTGSVTILKENRVQWPKGYKGAGVFLFMSPQNWSGSEGARVREIFLSKLKDRNISIENTRKANFPVVKNCKVAG